MRKDAERVGVALEAGQICPLGIGQLTAQRLAGTLAEECGTPRRIDERTIAVSAPSVRKPVNVRYNWADYPCGNLYGTTGLPVAPFRK